MVWFEADYLYYFQEPTEFLVDLVLSRTVDSDS
jgi:hypothetical protein